MSGRTFARAWTHWYTRGLPADVRDGRRAEIESDIHEHLADGGSGAAVFSRTVRGMVDDLSWRVAERTAMPLLTGFRAAWASVTQAWFAPAAVVVALCDIALALWVLTDADGKMPGRVLGPMVMVVLAAALLVGLYVRWRATQERASRPTALLGDSLIVIGTIPALAIWWMVVPAVFAVIVIAGVVGAGARRPAV